MKQILAIACVLMFAVAARAYTNIDYDWEDGGTVLAVAPEPYLPSLIATNVTEEGGNHVHWGSYSLRLEQNDSGGMSFAYLAYLWDLEDGDWFYAEFWRYDDTPGSHPQVRIAAHWNDGLPDDLDRYDGMAGGNDDCGPGQGWDFTEWSWEVTGGHTGMVLVAVVSGEVGDVVWLDSLYIGSPEADISIHIPGEPPVATRQRTWSDVKSMFR